MLDRLMCAAGSHVWSDWRFAKRGSCEQVRRCRRPNCDKTEHRAEHDFAVWHYAAANTCTEVQECRRCGEKNSRQREHDWLEWRYPASGSCRQVQQCARCPEYTERYVHIWNPPQYRKSSSADIAKQYCDSERICAQCGAVERGQSEHVWGIWQYETPRSCDLVRRCTRCGQTQSRSAAVGDHDWGEWGASNTTECYNRVRVCRRCGKPDQRRDQEPQHQWDDWQMIDPAQRLRRRVCRNCGRIQELTGL